jgi:hypothetical protein
MKTASSLLLLAVIALSNRAFGQDASNPLPSAPSSEVTNSNHAKSPGSPSGTRRIHPRHQVSAPRNKQTTRTKR